MYGEIIAIGDELVTGRVRNTTSVFAAEKLFQAGYQVKGITMIGDDAEAIKSTLLSVMSRANFVILTGGLGPTTDDITNNAVAGALGRRLVINEDILKKIHAERGLWGNTPDNMLEKLALLPEGAEFLNPDGCASGYLIINKIDNKEVLIFCLPGIPEQLEYLFMTQVIPRIKKAFSSKFTTRQRTFKIFGLQETEINVIVDGLLEEMDGITAGYYPNFPEVYLTISIIGLDKETVDRRFIKTCEKVEMALGTNLIGTGEDTQESVIGRLLSSRGANLAVAESCTGGLIAHRITSVPGSSMWFERGVISYSNRSKTEMLGVLPETLEGSGAVSRDTCIEMAKGIKRLADTTYGLSVTGFAGPSGGTQTEPVGAVYIALSTPESTWCERFLFSGSRHEIQVLSAETALDWLRRHLKYGTNIYSDRNSG
ncbi:MAG: CinA family nicotinamide mononucleotide deamidase-related protein [Dissulfurimicrobium sp.]|uniref:CinA family nicotinamide mononucleotide deamidase-related protein n=1 Tax=Dissulfurimicrobium sp. TaxID=2022436 RepID=UPI004049E3CB